MIVNLLDSLEEILRSSFSERKQQIESGELVTPQCFQFDFPQKTEEENEHFPHFLLNVQTASLQDDEEKIPLLIGLGVYSQNGYEDGCKQLLTMAGGVKLALLANKTIAKKFSLDGPIETAVLPKGEQSPPYYYGGVSATYHCKYITPVTGKPSVAFGGGYGDE